MKSTDPAALAEQRAVSLEGRNDREARHESGLIRVAAPSIAKAKRSAEPAFVGRGVQAILAAVPARATFRIVQSTNACTRQGFSFCAGGARPFHLSARAFSALAVARTDARTVHVESRGDDIFSQLAGDDWFDGRPGGDRAWMVLRDEEGVFGVTGLARDSDDGPFTPAEGRKLEELAPLVACCARAELAAMDWKRELAIVRALGPGHATYLLFDRDRERVVWASSLGAAVDWGADIEPIEKLLARTIEQFLKAHSTDEILPTPPRLPLGIVVAVAPVEEDTAFGAHCMGVGIQSPEDDRSPIVQLSARERAVVRLLVKGYEPANIAALTGIAEHTVRTYIRRAYKKLGVCRRADLVRRILAPDAGDAVAPRK